MYKPFGDNGKEVALWTLVYARDVAECELVR